MGPVVLAGLTMEMLERLHRQTRELARVGQMFYRTAQALRDGGRPSCRMGRGED